MAASAPSPASSRTAAWLAVAAAVALGARALTHLAALDHCDVVGCDFRVYHAEVRALARGATVAVPGWTYPPAAAVLFWPLGAMPEHRALDLWQGFNHALALVLVALCARELTSLGRGLRWGVALALVATSLPVFHTLAWGQVSLLVCVLSILGLRSGRWSVAGGAALGLAGALKLYPLAWLLLPLLQRRWRAVSGGILAATLAGLVVPLAVLGGPTTRLLTHHALGAARRAATPGGEWANGTSTAFGGGQGLGQLTRRWFVDSTHVGLRNTRVGLWVDLPQPVATGLTVLMGLGLVAVTLRALRACPPGGPRAAALALTAGSLLLSPAWHHYFAFLPFAAAVVLGHPQASRAARASTLAGLAVGAVPLVLVGTSPTAFATWSAWGGTTLAALGCWVGLVRLPSPEDPVATPGDGPDQGGVATSGVASSAPSTSSATSRITGANTSASLRCPAST